MRSIRHFLSDRHGGTAIEYGLICALIIIVIMGSLQLFANSFIAMFTHVSNAVTNVSVNAN